MTDPRDEMLDDILATARDARPTPSGDLVARVLNDATSQIPRGPGIFAQMLDLLGGWPTVGGLAAAGVAGVWIGIAPPATVEDMAANLLGNTVSVSLMPDATIFDTGEFLDG